jgi:hypothetical protein
MFKVSPVFSGVKAMLKRIALAAFSGVFLTLWVVGLDTDVRQGEYGRAMVGYIIMPVAAARGLVVFVSWEKGLALAEAGTGPVATGVKFRNFKPR